MKVRSPFLALAPSLGSPMLGLLAAAAVTSPALPCAPNGGETPTAIETRLVPAPATDGAFGFSVALDDTRAAVGAVGEGVDSNGALYVFERVGPDWTQMQRLPSGDGNTSFNFGFAVDIQGDTLVATGSEGFLEEVVAYAFEHDGSSWQRVLRSSLADTDHFFAMASSIALSGDAFAIGAGFEDDTSDQGRVEIYRRAPGTGVWNLEETLTAFDAQDSDLYGKSVGLHANTLAVGGGSDVYIYDHTVGSWGFTQQLNAPAGSGLTHTFAGALELDQDRLVVGHWGDDDNGTRSGSAYVYQRGGASFFLDSELHPGDAAAEQRFGIDVSLDGDAVVVASIAPRAYLFELDGGSWCETARLCEEPYASAVDVHGTRILEGGFQAPVGGGNAGAALVHRFDPPLGTNYCTAGTNTLGLEARIQALGSDVAADDELFLSVRDGVPDRFGIFFYGTNAIQVPLQDGFLCAGMSQRLNPISQLDACGSTSRRLSLSSEPALSDITLQAPIQMNFQFWYRDAMGSSNLTDGVAVDFQ